MTTEKRIIEWAADRGILNHGTKTGQTLKLLSEVGELACAVLRDNTPELLDAIGDVGVCVVIVAHMHGLEIEDLPRHHFRISDLGKGALQLMLHGGLLADAVAKAENNVIQAQLGTIWSFLNAFAIHLEWSFGEVLHSAYEIIEDRRGTMGPNGTWVKA